MDKHEDMSQEEKIAVIGENMRHLTESFDELKETLQHRDVEIHDHINRKFSDEMRIGLLELEKKVTEDTDAKIVKSIDELKVTIQTWALLLVFAVSFTVGTITYFNGGKKDNSLSVEQAQELYKTVAREVTKSNKAYLKATKTTGSSSEVENIDYP